MIQTTYSFPCVGRTPPYAVNVVICPPTAIISRDLNKPLDSLLTRPILTRRARPSGTREPSAAPGVYIHLSQWGWGPAGPNHASSPRQVPPARRPAIVPDNQYLHAKLS